jgi:hypothetical protein
LALCREMARLVFSPAGMPGGRRLEQVGLAGLILMFPDPFLPSWLFDSPRAGTSWPRRHVCGECGLPWTNRQLCATTAMSETPWSARHVRGARARAAASWRTAPAGATGRARTHQGRDRHGRLAAGTGRSNALFHRCAAQQVASSTCRRPGEPAGQTRVSSLSALTQECAHAPRIVPTADQVESTRERRFCWSEGR